MKTTIDIPDKVMEQVMRYSSAKTKKEAVCIALEDYNRRQRLCELADRLGTFDGFMSPEELEAQRSMDKPSW